MKWLDKYKQGGYVPCYECGGEIPMAQFGIHSGKHEKCEKFPDEKVKRTREGKERPSDVVSPYEEISNIKYFDKDQQKAMNTQYTELLGRMPGLSKDDFTAMYRDSVRTNANIIRPDYEKYFNKGALRPEYQNIKGNFTPAHLYYKERFPQGMTVEGALQYHNQPGMPAFSNIVNSGYKPLPQKQYGGELPMAQNGKTTKGTLIQEYQRKGNVEQRGGLRPILQEGIPRGDMQSYFPLPQSRQPNSDYGRRFTGESFPEYIVKDDPQSRINLRNYYNIGDPAKANTLDSAKYASTIPILRGMNFPRIRVNDESTLTKTYPVHFTPEQKDSISREQLLSGNTSYRNPGSRSRYFPSDNLMTVESRDFDPWAPLEAEMAHALQYSTRSDRQWIDWDEKSIELTKKHSSKDTYETPGTIEYDAHNENTGKAPQIETGINNNAAMRLRLKKQGLPWYKQGGDLPCYDCGGDILSAQKGKVLDKYQTKGTVTQEAKYLPIIRGQQYSEIGSIYESPYERNQQAIAEQEKREQEKPTGKQTTVGMPRQTVTLAEKIRRNKEYIDGKAHLSLSPQGNIVNSRPDLTLEGKYVSEKQEALVSGRVDNFINSANIASLGEFSGVVKPALNSAKRVIEKFNQTSVGQYINDVKQASKYANKLKLPTYRNVYRAEPLKYRQDGSDELAGRWFESDPNKTNFYVENLKSTDPNSGVRVLRTKLTDVDFNNQWGKNMSEEARRRSIGIGEYPDYRTARDAHSGDKTFQSIINMESNTLRPEDWADLYGNSSLYNKSEGILAGDLVNNLRYSVPSNPSTVSRSTNFGALDKATATKYLINATQKYESPILGIPRKYFPLKNGGIIKDDLGYWNPANHGKIVEINSPNITMKGVSQPLMGISNTGDVQYMTPGNDYNFDGERVTEIPMAQNGNKEGGEKNKFNTKLKGNASESFNYHSELFPSLLNDSFDYDTKGFYKQIYDEYNGDLDAITKALTPNSPTQHIGTDRYKKPNHPTFSNESKYSIPIIRPGGKWGHNEEEDYDYFKATRRNIKNMNNSDGSPFNYFKRAEDYNQDGIPDVKLFFRNEPVFKQGGWLNKYAEQEGNLPMAQTGKTIYTSDKKRVQAYKDSLTLYNSGERANRIASKRATDNKLPYEAMLEIQKDDEYNNALGRLKNVEPISSSPKYDVYTEGAGFDNTSFQFPRWAKPKEPVEYKKPKLDTSNWKQSSLDSLNLYNGGNEMAKWGKNNPNFTTTEHNKKADELDIKYPVSSMPWNKKNSFIGATNWATLNSTKSGYWGVPLYDKPVGVQKESVQPIKTIVKEVEKPIPSEPKVQDITPAPKKSVIPEQQRGQIVYGPTNSAIGYMTKNGFEPIKRRDHLAKANQAEIDLLNNPEALKQYVKEKLDRMRKGQ